MQKWLSIILLVISFPLFLYGCQPTPNTDTIIGKSSDLLDGVKEVEFQAYEVPSIIKSTEQISGLSLTINSSVLVPQTDGYSVFQIQKQTFDEAYYQNVMNYFHPGDEWITEPSLTKTDIIQRMAELNKLANEENIDVQTQLDELKNQLTEAPDKSDEHPFSFDNVKRGNMFYAFCNGSEMSSLDVLAGHFYGNTYQYRRNKDIFWVREENAETVQEKNDFATMEPTVPVEKALNIAKQAMQDLNSDPMMQLSYYTKAIGYKNQKAVSVGWEFNFMRNCNGLQASYAGNWSTWQGSPPPSNAAPWGYEFIFITVDDNGIVKFDTRGAGKQEKQLYHNVALLKFDNILERIKQQLVYNHAYQPDSVEEYYVIVNGIDLASALINKNDSMDTGILIPAWEIKYDFYERFQGVKQPTIYHCRIYLNAIDGSYIEPRAGIEQVNISQ